MVPVGFDEIVREPMSYEDFAELADGGQRAEWVDGEVLYMAPVKREHGFIAGRVIFVLLRQLTGVEAGPEVGVDLPRPSVRAPDVLLAPQLDMPGAGPWLKGSPEILLVVEILSRSTRTEDLMRKPAEYAAAGIQRYWIIDPGARIIDAFRLVDGEWSSEASLDHDHPAAEFDFGGHGVATIELTEILGARADPA